MIRRVRKAYLYENEFPWSKSAQRTRLGRKERPQHYNVFARKQRGGIAPLPFYTKPQLKAMARQEKLQRKTTAKRVTKRGSKRKAR